MIIELSTTSLHRETWSYYSISYYRYLLANSSQSGCNPTKLPYFHHGAIELEESDGSRFKVNGQRMKLYFGNADKMKIVKVWALGEM